MAPRANMGEVKVGKVVCLDINILPPRGRSPILATTSGGKSENKNVLICPLLFVSSWPASRGVAAHRPPCLTYHALQPSHLDG